MANQHTYRPPFTEAELRSSYRSGMSQDEVAAKYGTTQKVVYHAMKKYGIKARKQAPRNQRGENNNNWKGGEARYQALHIRVQKQRGKPRCCEVCGTKSSRKHYDWANMTGRYDDPSDYRRMCRSCHHTHDRRHLNFTRKGARLASR